MEWSLVGLLSVLQIIFVVVKLIGLVAWSWFIVFIPAYLMLAIALFWTAIVVYGQNRVLKEFDEFDQKHFGDGKDREN